jgi:hypothetical protein
MTLEEKIEEIVKAVTQTQGNITTGSFGYMNLPSERLRNLLNLIKVERPEFIDLMVKIKNEIPEYFLAPASSKSRYHNSFYGGLLLHSLNVAEVGLVFQKSLFQNVKVSSIVICGLLHDLGKAQTISKKPYYQPNILKSGKQSEAEPFERGEDANLTPVPMSSLYFILRSMDLHPDEFQAILTHDGQYVTDNKWVAMSETPLTMLIQWSDVYSTRIEQGTQMVSR